VVAGLAIPVNVVHMAAFQYHDSVCVVAGLAIPAAQQNSFDQQRLIYTLIIGL
jgi:hypothetical protein